MREQTDNTFKRRRDRLDDAARHELAVIDRVLVGNHTEGADDAEIAEFALRLRAERPTIGDDGRARLDTRFAERISEERTAVANPGPIDRLRGRFLSGVSRPAPLAGALATLFVVVGVTVALSSDPLNETVTVSSEGRNAGTALSGAPTNDSADSDVAESGRAGGDSQGSTNGQAMAKSAPATTHRLDELSSLVAEPNRSTSAIRRVERSGDLTLATPSVNVENVADGVIATTDRFNGFVETSTVSGGDAGDASANFILRLPSDRYQEALAALSGLAHVRERTQNTRDITDSYERAADRLKSARAESNRLRAKLAATTDETQAKIVRLRLRRAEASESARRREMQAMRNRVSNVTLGVTIVADETAEITDRGTIGRALDKAVDILTQIAAVAIVSLAILAPLALLALAIRFGYRRLRRSRDESVLDSTAAPTSAEA
ncbi:MAG: DUF4349 domain-containing protein [Actinobacteria bacterium]|nr:DUF4349 domain-containing protein [Actinomycetota bacterium]